ncbi:MAG: hypothetical protein ABMA64_13000, partial [Myxococcota bacterium]
HGAPADVVRIETAAVLPDGLGVTVPRPARELRATVVGRDAQGRVVLRGEGVRLRAAGRGVADA